MRALASETPEGLQTVLDVASCVATWTSLRFNPRKCATLHVDGKKRETIHTNSQFKRAFQNP